MSAQAIGLGGQFPCKSGSPNGATLNLTNTQHVIDDDEQSLSPPRWGYALVFATVTQADGLGWHRDATLWRRTLPARPIDRVCRRATFDGRWLTPFLCFSRNVCHWDATAVA